MVDFTMSKEVNDRRSSSLPESSSSTAVNTPGVLSSRKKSRTEIMCSDVSNLIVPTGSTKKRRIEMVVAKQEEDEGGRKGIGSATAEVGGTFEDEDRIGIVKDVEEEVSNTSNLNI